MEAHQNPDMEFLHHLSGSSRRALEREELITLQMLASTTKEELQQIHGLEPKEIQAIDEAMKKVGLTFRE